MRNLQKPQVYKQWKMNHEIASQRLETQTGHIVLEILTLSLALSDEESSMQTGKNATELLQIVNFTICQQVATNLSISSSCTSLLKSGLLQLVICKLVNYNLLKQLVASVWIKSFDHQLATNLLTTLNRLVVNKLSPLNRK